MMQAKTIKAVLSKKFNDFAKSIEDVQTQALVRKNTIITGGCITSLLLNEDVNDYDLYFTNYATTKAVADYYTQKFNLDDHKNKKAYVETDGSTYVKIFIKSAGVAGTSEATTEEKEIEKYVPTEDASEQTANTKKYAARYLTSNAITLSDDVQLILRFFGTPEEIHKNYDFVHATNYYLPSSHYLHMTVEALESILSKTLRYKGSRYPIASLIRTRKFIQRGWHINAGQYLKMAFQVSELDLTDIRVLEDQLIGVDVAYFMQIIAALQTKGVSDPDFVVTGMYLNEIIDRIF